MTETGASTPEWFYRALATPCGDFIIDQPLALVAALRTLLADWDHSVPRRRI